MKPRLLAMGDSALLIKFGEEIDPVINQRVHQLDALLRADQIAGVIETVPAYATLLLHYDPLLLTYAQASEWVNIELAKVKSDIHRKPRRIEVLVRYGGEHGPDLDLIASLHHISKQEVISLHTGREYIVYMMGFTPGFAYMGKLDDMLTTPRLETPRIRVAAGSVGIAGSQTGIYPIDSPGGWRLIGRTSLPLFDLASDTPFLFSPGDTVHFVNEGLDA
jgi:KipI family sensor histidine kinase inhibitor